MRSITCFPSNSGGESWRVAQAFAAGAQANGIRATVAPAKTAQLDLHDGIAVFYGMNAHTLPLIIECRRRRRAWIYIDNAYYYGRGSMKRCTLNRVMHDGRGEYPRDRWRAFGETIKPRRPPGRNILLTSQSDLFYRFLLGVPRDAWLDQVKRWIRAYTDREIVVCHKPDPHTCRRADDHREFEPLLADAYMLATHSSSTAVKALIEGVPVLWLGQGEYAMARDQSIVDPADIDDPRFPSDQERERWIAALTCNQWTLDEIRSGAAWRGMKIEQ